MSESLWRTAELYSALNQTEWVRTGAEPGSLLQISCRINADFHHGGFRFLPLIDAKQLPGILHNCCWKSCQKKKSKHCIIYLIPHRLTGARFPCNRAGTLRHWRWQEQGWHFSTRRISYQLPAKETNKEFTCHLNLGRICANGWIFNSPVFLRRANLQKEGNCRRWCSDWWSCFLLWPLNDALPQDIKWYRWFLTGALSLVQCVYVTVSSRYLEPSTRPLVLGHRRNQWRVVSGQQAAARVAACQPSLESCCCLSRRDGAMWEGEYELMVGLPLSQKQTRALFHKWARWLFLNGAETWVGSRRSAKVRCGHLEQQQLIHLRGVTELQQNMILSPTILHLICVFGFPVRRACSPSQMMYWRKSSDGKL